MSECRKRKSVYELNDKKRKASEERNKTRVFLGEFHMLACARSTEYFAKRGSSDNVCSVSRLHRPSLSAGHHQLSRLTTLTEELISAVQTLQKSTAESTAASTPAAPALSPDPLNAANTSPRLALPEKYEGDPAVFENAKEGKGAEDLLLELTQGKSPASENALTFRTLAAQTNWTENAFKVVFRRGLSHELQAELACRDEGKGFDQFVHLTIQIDNLMRSRRSSHRSTSALRVIPAPRASHSSADAYEPMQINASHISEEERERRRTLKLCMYCGGSGHFRLHCPLRPALKERTLVHEIALIPCTSPLSVEAVDGRPLGTGRITHMTQELHMRTGLLHHEKIHPHTPVILGLPWLRNHNPHLQWTTGQIVSWGESCFSRCLSTVKPLPVRSISEPRDESMLSRLPAVYHDLAEAFSKVKATQLPPHREYDCAIDLLPGTTPPRGRIFPMSQPETEAMQKNIEEELAKGFIRHSTSPVSAGFFFVKKKDGGLRPCIDYRSLN
ncbi:hypothetical protein PO909_002370 [Leuciscus waleckii]